MYAWLHVSKGSKPHWILKLLPEFLVSRKVFEVYSPETLSSSKESGAQKGALQRCSWAEGSRNTCWPKDWIYPLFAIRPENSFKYLYLMSLIKAMVRITDNFTQICGNGYKQWREL